MSAHDDFRPNDPNAAVPPSDEAITERPAVDGVAPGPFVVPASGDDTITPPVARPPHPGFLMAVVACFVFLLCTQIPGGVVTLVVAIVLSVVAKDRYPIEGAADLTSPLMRDSLAVGLLVTQLLVIGFSLAVIRLFVGPDWTRQLALRRPGFRHLLLALLSFPAMVLLADGTYEWAKQFLPSINDLMPVGKGGKPYMEQMVELFRSWPAAFGVLVIGVGPGIGEELWCRGFLGRGLVGRYGYVVGVVFTSFFFGLIHLDPQQGFMAMLMGLWLHFVYLTGRSLWLPILLHFLNNSFSMLVPYVPDVESLMKRLAEFPGLTYPVAGILLLAVGVALYRSRARVVGGPPEPYPTVAYPPPDSGAAVVWPGPGWGIGLLVLVVFVAFVVNCAMVYLGVVNPDP